MEQLSQISGRKAKQLFVSASAARNEPPSFCHLATFGVALRVSFLFLHRPYLCLIYFFEKIKGFPLVHELNGSKLWLRAAGWWARGRDGTEEGQSWKAIFN